MDFNISTNISSYVILTGIYSNILSLSPFTALDIMDYPCIDGTICLSIPELVTLLGKISISATYYVPLQSERDGRDLKRAIAGHPQLLPITTSSGYPTFSNVHWKKSRPNITSHQWSLLVTLNHGRTNGRG
ncbi:hypothetical protein J6590_004454 [Homalodisca vitripennis]|nr:hypothetical protein J6590_004454 [Homalodisca vitripennis]